MDILAKIHQLTDARGWSIYRLSKECGLSESTLRNLFSRNTMPSIPTLEAICGAFGITLSQFFAEADLIEYTPDLKRLVAAWAPLTDEQKDALLKLMDASHHV